jgi:hypothetical protein
MNAATGFTLLMGATEDQLAKAAAARQQALEHFPDLKLKTITIGEARLELWGREAPGDGALDRCIYTTADGSLLALVGSPVGNRTWQSVEEALAVPENFRLPWEGRVILLHIRADGSRCTMWNDWLGSIPVFTTTSGRCLASTIEPVVVAAGGFTSDDFFLPGLLLLLTHGNFLADWTLYQDMHTVRPDSMTIWDGQGYRSRACASVQATADRWETGWNDLLEEMHALAEKAIRDLLKTQPAWVVPLSSGLDSRLIAAVGAAAGSQIRTYTWGPSTTRDTVYSCQIARALNLPWQRIDLGDDYLARYLPLWVNLFGSAMHFHGMYQIPFLEAIKQTPPAPIASGFIGDCLGGYDVRFQTELHHPGDRYYFSHPTVYLHYEEQDLKNLLRVPIDAAMEQIKDQIVAEKNAIDGPWFQKLRFVTLWGRQNHFTYFQSMLCDYWRGVGAPYLDREYARFCLSLPRIALDDRRMQIEMMKRFYPRVMDIGGTYAPEPGILTGSYLLKRRAARKLPHFLVSLLLPEFTATKNIKTDITSLRACGEKAIWPIPEKAALLAEWMDMEQINKTYQEAVGGDIRAVRRLQSVQSFAYRL